MIHLVYGPPGAGKTTYAEEHAADQDLVIDLDRIRQQVGDERTARKLRTVMEAGASRHNGDVWIVRTLAQKQARDEFRARVGVGESHLVTIPAEQSRARVQARDGDDSEKLPAIDRWWADYEPDEGAEETDMVPEENTQQQAPQEQAPAEGQQQTPEGQQQTPTEGQQEQAWPADTPVAEMTVEQRAAYWKHHSRRHEQNAKDLREQVERLEQQVAAKSEPQGEDPVATAQEEARREIFEARFDAAAAKHPDTDYSTLRKHLALETFIGEDGKISREVLEALFESLPSGATTGKEPEGWGNNAPFDGATGITLGRELFNAAHAKK